MFTTKDKVKELVEFLLHGQNVSCLVCKNKMYAPVGVSVVMTYKFEVKDMEIIYDKWFVEDFEDASKMQLPGCEHHDQLVKGSGVTVLSKKMGSFIFHGNKANEIINACEIGRDMTSTYNEISTHIYKIKIPAFAGIFIVLCTQFCTAF